MTVEGPIGIVPRNQFGALCWRMRGNRPQILLITSRDTGRWVIPKGWPMDGIAGDAAAMREAWEEAGATGRLQPPGTLGFFAYRKGLGPTIAVPCLVEVFSLRVEKLASQFPERGQRQRKWFSQEKAARKVDEPELRALILAFSPPNSPLKDRKAKD